MGGIEESEEDSDSSAAVRRATLVGGVQFNKTALRLPTFHPLRRAAITVFLSPWFERVTMTVILLNCVTLGSYEPCRGTGQCVGSCAVLSNIDHLIFGYFTLGTVTSCHIFSLNRPRLPWMSTF